MDGSLSHPLVNKIEKGKAGRTEREIDPTSVQATFRAAYVYRPNP